MITNPFRRKLLKIFSIALVSAPIVVVSKQARATTNQVLRAKLKYQNAPLGDKSCSNCMAFQPGKTESELGKCSIISDDDEISPNGYCTGWYTL